MLSSFTVWLALPLVGLAVAIVLTVVGARLTSNTANGLLIAAWILCTLSIFVLPYVAKLDIIPRFLWTILIAAVTGLCLYQLRWPDPVAVTETSAPSSANQTTEQAAENFQLHFHAITRAVARQPGTIIGGIPWRSNYGELKIWIINPTDFDYQRVDLQIMPDVAVTAAAQLTNIAGVSISINSNPDITLETVNTSSGKRVDMPLNIIASTVGYQLRCGLLPARSTVELIMAVVLMHDGNTTVEVDKVLRVNLSDGTSVWSAHPKHTDKIFGNKPVPNVVKVAGRYTVKQKEYQVSENIPVKDFVLDSMRDIPKQNHGSK